MQEKNIRNNNKQLENNLKETFTIYEYVKNLNSILDFEEALKQLQKTLADLTTFSKGKLILINNNKVSDIHTLNYDQSINSQKLDLKSLSEFEKSLLKSLKNNPAIISFNKGQKTSFGELPHDLNTLVVIPLIIEKQLVSILVVEDLPIKNIDKIHFVTVQFALEVNKTMLFKLIKKHSIFDSLTQLYLRRHFLELLKNETDRCYRQKVPLSFLMIDIDYFKQYNDEYGHLVGDLILKRIADILRQKSRESDLLCRYGGDEFALALPRIVSDDALMIAERLRRGINEYLHKVTKEEFQVAVSIGIYTCQAQHMRDSDIVSKIIDSADSAMYRAKAQGRNKVVLTQS